MLSKTKIKKHEVFKHLKEIYKERFEKIFPKIDFENLIKEKLDSSFNFFQKGTVIQLEAEWTNKTQKRQLEELFEAYGLILQYPNADKQGKEDV